MMQVLNICSHDFDWIDYMAAAFYRWLKEPERLVFLTMEEQQSGEDWAH